MKIFQQKILNNIKSIKYFNGYASEITLHLNPARLTFQSIF